MPTTPEQLKTARSWIGESETSDIFNERFDRLGSLDLAIVESLRSQIGVLESDQPASFGLPSGLNASFSSNITELKDTLEKFIAGGGTPEDPTALPGSLKIVRLVRPDYR